MNTNSRPFKLETEISDDVCDFVGYYFHVLNINEQKYWIGKELAHAFGYRQVRSIFTGMDKEDVNTLILTKDRGLPLLKLELNHSLKTWEKYKMEYRKGCWNKSKISQAPNLLLVSEDTLKKFLIFKLKLKKGRISILIDKTPFKIFFI